MEVAEVNAPEQKKLRPSLLRNPQVNSSLSSCASVRHFATSLRRIPHQTHVSYLQTHGRGKAEADAPINVYRSRSTRHHMQGSARSKSGPTIIHWSRTSFQLVSIFLTH